MQTHATAINGFREKILRNPAAGKLKRIKNIVIDKY
jgi:hypothetical protein